MPHDDCCLPAGAVRIQQKGRWTLVVCDCIAWLFRCTESCIVLCCVIPGGHRSWELFANSRKGCIWRREGCAPPQTIIQHTCSSDRRSFLHAWAACVHEKQTIIQWMSIGVCVCVYSMCACVQHLACRVQGVELWRMCCAYTQSPWNSHKDNKLHTLIH